MHNFIYKHTLRRLGICFSEQSIILDVARFFPARSTVQPLFLGLQQSSSSHCCSSLLWTPPLTLSPCPHVMSTHIRLKHTIESHSHSHPSECKVQTIMGWKERENQREKERGKEGFTEGCIRPGALMTSSSFDPLMSATLCYYCTLQLSHVLW